MTEITDHDRARRLLDRMGISWNEQDDDCAILAAEFTAAREEGRQEERKRWMECAKYDATVPRALFRTWDRSALDRLRKSIENDTETGGLQNSRGMLVELQNFPRARPKT